MDFIEAWTIYNEWLISGRGSEGVPRLQQALDILNDSPEEMAEAGFEFE